MTTVQRATHAGHPAPGATLTAAQRALQQDRNSLPSDNVGGMPAGIAAAAGMTTGEDDEGGKELLAVSLSQLQTPPAIGLAASQQTSQPPQQQQLTPKVPSSRNSAAGGMRREWKFALQFVHVAGQLLVSCSPQWEYDFIDIDRTAYGLAQRTVVPSSTDATPMLAVLAYTDYTAVVQPAPPTSAINSPGAVALHQHSGNGSGGVGAAAAAAAAAAYEELLSTASAVGGSGDAAAAAGGGGGDWWVEKSKQVQLFYCHPAPAMTLEQFCKLCVKFVLRDPHVVSVDGDTRLAHLHVGDKLRCPHMLGGTHRSFHMRYTLHDRSELQESYVYAIGALVGQRGYLLRAQCTSADELEGYVHSVLLPTYTTAGRSHFGVDVTYHNTSPTTLLTDQQEAFGELQYVDHKAAVVFVTPVYPMKILPDYSPAKTVGVGSITCMTLQLSVHERLLDDAVAAEIIGVAKYKVNPVVLCVEVEEVSRMGYPKVMSTEQYSELKAKRVADVFPDAKMVGLPTSLYMGNRTGRSRTMTFTYEPLRCAVKALVTSTLVGNFGVTAFYLTKLSGGLFDSHLYVFQQLLSGMEFLPQNSFAKNTRVSRYQAQNIRLGEEDLLRAYRCANSNFYYNATQVHRSSNGGAAAKRDGGGHGSSPIATAEVSGGGGGIGGSLDFFPPLPPHPASFTVSDPAAVHAARERHQHMLALGNDGRVEDGVEAVVPADEGGVPTPHALQGAASGQAKRRRADRRTTAPVDAAGATRPSSASLFSSSPSMLTAASMTSGDVSAAAAADHRRSTRPRNGGLGEGDGNNLYYPATATTTMLMSVEAGSMHSGSRISVEDLSHLIGSLSDSRDETTSNDEEDEEDEEGGIGYMENERAPSITSQDDAAGREAAAIARAPSSSSLHRHGSQRSPTGSRPTSSKRRKHGGQHCSLDAAPFSPSSSSSAAAEAGEKAATELDTAAAAKPPDTTTSAGAVADTALADTAATGADAVALSNANEEALQQQALYEQLIGKGDPLVLQTLREGEGCTPYGPSLRDVYARCCEAQQCRPNSYLMQKLPAQPTLTYSVEELDLSSNYVGHNGFVAVLHLLEHLPRLRAVYFNNMTLDNVDVESLCYVLATNATVRAVHLENNTGISLPAMRHFTALLRVNRHIEVLSLDGTRLSPTLVASLKAEASRARD
ncbi:hypothetical protein ABB37_09341 [Leptomonas pyrrhocoris]|uniref:Uncharacterized protein n=1 Tax=Leptomonas pyrrhocoris TaxID=157538 RepID=A0A0N0DRA1_LEPPY|nr:hypothetical protein ABB37_09341 [Leptomonas pyrrhocoris]KPA74362.1 hypothetical protein ABB37_09341 [Leptomonas pyrrhocoris]|eukprot:XP_015652801.1 hypothetical protein ABB37_09341 [Leptomonas pyrrhocoris]